MPKDLQCTHFQHILHSKNALNQHIQRIHESFKYFCPYFQKEFTGESYCKNHIQHCQLAIPVKCMKCNKAFNSRETLNKYLMTLITSHLTVSLFQPLKQKCESRNTRQCQGMVIRINQFSFNFTFFSILITFPKIKILFGPRALAPGSGMERIAFTTS